MGVTWTEEQQKVIDLRNRNILVSAAAGSGKTAVLVERIITMLTKDPTPVDVDRLLIVTFTEAAAAEMKERIRVAIEKALEAYPENEHLKQQATLIHNARITTIHSFCLSVIRDHFPAIDLDPGFRVGEEGELKLLRHDVLETVLEEKYQEGERRFLDFASAYGAGKNDKKLEELILKIYEISRSYPDADNWLEECVEAYRIRDEKELEENRYVKIAMENVKKYLADLKELIEQGIDICLEADGPAAYEGTLRKDLALLEELEEETSFGELCQKVSKAKLVRLAINKDETVSEEKISQVKSIRDELRKMIKDLGNQYFSQSPEEILADLSRCQPAIEELKELVIRFQTAFEEKKRARNLIDFSDMEQYALQILASKTEDGWKPSEIAVEYQEQFQEIMIDEYQDSNLIQETILTSISRVHQGQYNMFMVGDVKQSIYRFRLSRPELFMEKFRTYSTDDSRMQRIDLHKNFRSRSQVLGSVNYLFRQLMTQSLGGITYDDQAALYVGASYPEGEGQETEVLMIDSRMEEYEAGKISERELEARVIARRIKELLSGFQVVDKETGDFRPVRYRDIVILTRSVQGIADVFAEVLNREGIPAYAGTKEGYFDAWEVGVVLDYLRILDNRCQDIPLAAALVSPFGKVTETELAAIRSVSPKKPFFEAVIEYLSPKAEDEEQPNPVIVEKLRHFFETLNHYQRMVPYTPMHELLWKILTETGYGDYVYALPGGEQRRANLEMLMEKARSYESTSYKGLFHFVRYIEQLQKYNVDYGEANMEDEQSDTVRIMTIHKSKGLEFPVVFVAGLGKRFNMTDARSSVVIHAGLGIGLDAVNLKERTKRPSLIKKMIQKEEVLDSLGEELRVLYVALTRAKEKLILTGTMMDPAKQEEAVCMLRSRQQIELGFGRLSKASTFWDWILPALARIDEHIPICRKYWTILDVVEGEIKERSVKKVMRAAFETWERMEECKQREQKTGDGLSGVTEQFGYRYPYASESGRKLKFTVSELKKQIYFMEKEEALGEDAEALYEEPEVAPLIPKFLKKEEKLTGALRGTAYHRLMELLDFADDYDGSKLAKVAARFIAEGRMTQEMKDCIQTKDILTFLSCDLGLRMKEAARSGRLWKEQPFVLGVDASDVYPDEQEGELLLVQGIIDVYFEEADGLVVLDYKTDRVSKAEELMERYHGQLDYYSKALEQITGKRVKEKWIYSFTLQQEIKLP